MECIYLCTQNTTGQDLLFVATPLINNFEKVKNKLKLCEISQGGTGSQLGAPTSINFPLGTKVLIPGTEGLKVF